MALPPLELFSLEERPPCCRAASPSFERVILVTRDAVARVRLCAVLVPSPHCLLGLSFCAAVPLLTSAYGHVIGSDPVILAMCVKLHAAIVGA